MTLQKLKWQIPWKFSSLMWVLFLINHIKNGFGSELQNGIKLFSVSPGNDLLAYLVFNCQRDNGTGTDLEKTWQKAVHILAKGSVRINITRRKINITVV